MDRDDPSGDTDRRGMRIDLTPGIDDDRTADPGFGADADRLGVVQDDPGPGRLLSDQLMEQDRAIRRGTAAELVAYYEARPPKGEITLVISGMR